MESRLTGVVATLWFFFAVLSLFIAVGFSPLGLRLLLPGTHPNTWIYPALLTLPPIALGSSRIVGSTNARLLLWPLATVLGVAAVLLFAYLAATFVGH